MIQELIDRYLAGAASLRELSGNLSESQLDATPVPGTWSLRQIVFHLMHSDMIGIDRMTRIIYEDRPPLLMAYNETSATGPMLSASQPAEEMAELFELNRKWFARIAVRLGRATWDRFGIHSEVGRTTLAEQLGKYVKHAEHHLEFARKKRAMLGA